LGKRKKFYPGDLVFHNNSEMTGVVLKFSNTWPIVMAHRYGHNVRDVYEILFSNGLKEFVYDNKLVLVERADKG